MKVTQNNRLRQKQMGHSFILSSTLCFGWILLFQSSVTIHQERKKKSTPFQEMTQKRIIEQATAGMWCYRNEFTTSFAKGRVHFFYQLQLWLSIVRILSTSFCYIMKIFLAQHCQVGSSKVRILHVVIRIKQLRRVHLQILLHIDHNSNRNASS